MADTNLLVLAREYKKLREEVKKVLSMPKGDKGDRGEKGEKGDKGDTGPQGFPGRDGKDGVNGYDGKDGRDGVDGKDGKDGLDGVGVQNAYIDFDNSLVIVLTDGTEINAGFLSQEAKENVVATFKQGAATINELLPDQAGNTDKVLKTDGSNVYWATVSGGGTETDPVVGAVNGIVKANGSGTISAAVAGTDYLAPSAIANMLETSDIGVTVQGYSAVLAGTTASFTTADETKLDGIEAGADVTDAANVEPLVNAHLNTSTAASGEVLSWNGTDYDWITPPSGYSDSSVDAHLNTSTATTGQVLGWNGTDYDWVDQSGGGGSAGVTVSDTPPASPTAGAQWLDTRSGALLTWYVGTSSSAWVSVADDAPAIPPTFVSQATATTTSISTMPSHQAGDFLVMFAYNSGSTTVPTLPSGWTNVAAAGLNTNAYRIGIKVAASSSETSGTWTSATRLNLQVYRNTSGVGAVAATSGASTTITYPALTLQNTNGGSAVVLFAGKKDASPSITTPPTGSTLRSSTNLTAGFDTNGGVSSWSQQTVAVGGSSVGWWGVSLELRPQAGLFTAPLGTLDFPASPFVGQTYTQSGNTFLWDGTAWLYRPAVDLSTSSATGILPVSKGGTGLSTLTANNVMLGNGTSSPTFVAPGASGNVLVSNGTTWQSAAPAASGGAISKGYRTGSFWAYTPTGIQSIINFGGYYEVTLDSNSYSSNPYVSVTPMSAPSGSFYVSSVGTFAFRIYGVSDFTILGFQ